jgi:hypothetical protein
VCGDVCNSLSNLGAEGLCHCEWLKVPPLECIRC